MPTTVRHLIALERYAACVAFTARDSNTEPVTRAERSLVLTTYLDELDPVTATNERGRPLALATRSGGYDTNLEGN